MTTDDPLPSPTASPETLPAPRRGRRLVSVWLPRFATDRISRRQRKAGSADWPDRPLVVVTPQQGAVRLQAVNRPATRAGLAAGQTLADARTLAPALVAVDADPVADRAALTALARWAVRYTPWVAVGARDDEHGGAAGLWLDISGCAHLFTPPGRARGREARGERALLADLTARLAALGYGARAGLADTAGAAWAVARFGGAPTGGRHDRFVIVPPGEHAAVLAALPVAALRLPAALREALDRLGLRRIAQLTALPRAGLADRFGPALARRLDQAYGRIDEPLAPLAPPPELKVEASFAEPLGRPEDVRAAIRRLLEALLAEMERHGIGVRRLAVVLHRLGGRAERLAVGTARATRAPAHLMRLIDSACERLASPAGGDGRPENFVETIALAVPAHAPLPAVQSGLPDTGAAAGGAAAGGAAAGGEHAIPIDQLIDRLIGRLGADAVIRLTPQASHLPERAQAPVRLIDAADDVRHAAPAMPGGSHVMRPPRLLKRPQPLVVVAPVPDDPPLLFRWRGRVHRVVRAAGPERLSAEWWRGPSPLGTATRDYYRLEDEHGGRFWVYRLGLYEARDDDEPTTLAAPRWYLHGFFG